MFQGTRVPVKTLFDHLEAGISLTVFLEDFPTVRKEQAIALIQIAKKQLVAVTNVSLSASRFGAKAQSAFETEVE